MRSIFLIALTSFFFFGATTPEPPKAVEGGLVKWYTFEEAMEAHKKNPKKLMVDAYTSWCGWCRKLDAATFNNPTIAEYLNTYYYPVKFNGEGNEEITIADKSFSNPAYDPAKARGRNSRHELANFFKISSYPTVVFVDENLSVIQAIPGFRGPKDYEPIIAYFGMDHYKQVGWEEFQKTFKSKLPAPPAE